jgi:membrane-associated phospholipid phosphatase
MRSCSIIPTVRVWAAVICYAQVYVGKHYPFDILVGAIFGFLTGLGTFRLFVYWETRPIFATGGGLN